MGLYGWQQEGLSVYPNSLDVVTWYPLYSPIVLHTKALLNGYLLTIDPTQYVNTSWYWADYGNAPCLIDLYIYCNYGIIPTLIIIFVLVLLLVLANMRIAIVRHHIVLRRATLRDITTRNLKMLKTPR